MTPANRRFVVWLGLVVIASVGGWAVYHRGRITRVALLPQARLVADDLARMQLAFGQSGLNDFEIRDGQIYVDRAKQDLYLKALAEKDALPDISQSLYEPEAGVDLWSNRQQQHEKTLVRKKKMIRQMLLQLGFVADAHVDLDELTEPGFPPQTTRKVAVVIRSRGDRILERHQVRAIRDTVLGQVAGVEPHDVVITDIAAGHAYNAAMLDEGSAPRSESLVWLEQARLTQRLNDWLQRYSTLAEVQVSLAPGEPSSAAANGSSSSGDQTPEAEPAPRLLINQPVALAETSDPAAVASQPPTRPAEPRFTVNAQVFLPNAGRIAAAIPTPLTESQRLQLEQQIAAELRPLLVSEELACCPGSLQVRLEPAALPLATAGATEWNSALRWTRQNSLLVLIGAGGLLLVALAWLFRAGANEPSASAATADYPPARWDARERSPHIPLNDETRRRLRQVVSDDPDRAAEIIKNWIRDAA